jgi:hypothetical protein
MEGETMSNARKFRVGWLALVMLGALLVFMSGMAWAASVLPAGIPVWIGPLLLAAVQWLAGVAVKKRPDAVNQGIGWLTLLLSAVGYAIVPAPANAAVNLGALLGPVKALGYPLAVLLQTALVTGIHEWLLGSVIEPLNGKLSKATTYLKP